MFYNTLALSSALLLSSSFLGDVSAAAVKRASLRQMDRTAYKPLAARGSGNELTPFPMTRLGRRDGGNSGDYALKMSDTWYWGSNTTSNQIAKLDCNFQSPNGSIPLEGKSLALERIAGDFSDISCDNSGISIQFKDQSSYDTAKSSWNWVNEKDSRFLAAVTKAAACGGVRQAHKVTGYTTDDGSKSIKMTGTAVDFKDAFSYMNFKLNTEGVDAPQNATLSKRISVSGSDSFSVAHDFGGTNFFNQNIGDNLNVALTCGTCNTQGSFNFEVEASVSIIPPSFDASVTVTPSGVSATVGLDLVVSGELTSAFNFPDDKPILQIPLFENPLSISGVAELGPVLQVDLEADISSVSAQADISLGSITLSIPDDSKATLDLFDPSKDAFVDFVPQFSTNGPSVSGGVSASAHAGPIISLGVDVTVLGKGVAAGLALAAPTLDITASFNENGCSGVDFEADLSAQLNAFAGAGKVADIVKASTISIVGTTTQIFSTCLTVPSDAPAAATTAAPAPAQATGDGSFGGVAGTTLSDAGCQSKYGTLSTAASVCASQGGDASFTNACDPSLGANLCCGSGQGCSAETINGVSGVCCA